jgi:hypothetical protein
LPFAFAAIASAPVVEHGRDSPDQQRGGKNAAELPVTVARLARYAEFSSVDVAEAHEAAARNVSEALRGFRTLAGVVRETALPISLVVDDRITCRQCAKRAGELCGVKASATVVDWPRRCRSFEPRSDEQDPRSGRERWTWLQEIGK